MTYGSGPSRPVEPRTAVGKGMAFSPRTLAAYPKRAVWPLSSSPVHIFNCTCIGIVPRGFPYLPRLRAWHRRWTLPLLEDSEALLKCRGYMLLHCVPPQGIGSWRSSSPAPLRLGCLRWDLVPDTVLCPTRKQRAFACQRPAVLYGRCRRSCSAHAVQQQLCSTPLLFPPCVNRDQCPPYFIIPAVKVSRSTCDYHL